MLDHVSVQCEDPAASAAFYDAVLATVGGGRVLDFGAVIGYGAGGKPDFCIGPHHTGQGFRESHLAFQAPSRAAVRDFFAAAVGTGAEVLYEPRSGPSTTPATTPRSSATRMATTSRLSATSPRTDTSPQPRTGLLRIVVMWLQNVMS